MAKEYLIPILTPEVDITDKLQFSVTFAPSTPNANTVVVYLTASGVSPNRTLEWRMKNEAGEELILSSLIV